MRDCSNGVPWSDEDLARMVEHLRAERLKLGDDQKPKPKTAAQAEVVGLDGGALLAKLGLTPAAPTEGTGE